MENIIYVPMVFAVIVFIGGLKIFQRNLRIIWWAMVLVLGGAYSILGESIALTVLMVIACLAASIYSLIIMYKTNKKYFRTILIIAGAFSLLPLVLR